MQLRAGNSRATAGPGRDCRVSNSRASLEAWDAVYGSCVFITAISCELGTDRTPCHKPRPKVMARISSAKWPLHALNAESFNKLKYKNCEKQMDVTEMFLFWIWLIFCMSLFEYISKDSRIAAAHLGP